MRRPLCLAHLRDDPVVMNAFRRSLRGLVSKLALFYLLLSLPTLLVVETVVMSWEFQGFLAGVKTGSLNRAAAKGGSELESLWPHMRLGAQPDSLAMSTWLEGWLLRLQQPKGGLTPDESYILLELREPALAAAIIDKDSRIVSIARGLATWHLDLPTEDEISAALQGTDRVPQVLAGKQNDYSIQRVLVPLHASGGDKLGFLFVELRVPTPWRHLMIDASVESPVIFAFLIVFGLASSIFLAAWVTRRLRRIERAASAWSRGDFSNRINDHARDEIGGLSDMLDRMALDLRSLLRSRSQLAALAERQRLARDLHDTVKQKAFALNMQLATARRTLGDAAGAERLEPAQRLTQQIQQELGLILDELRATDAELPFAERLRVRANDWAHTSGASLGFAIDDVPSLAPAVEDTLLRIVDEALSNVLRHSGAQHVDLSLRRTAERVILVIADNGSGISADVQGGMGLRNMRERIEALPRGRFEFDSTPGQGTRVTLSFNIEES
jgi:signal transduction histidine kinase